MMAPNEEMMKLLSALDGHVRELGRDDISADSLHGLADQLLQRLAEIHAQHQINRETIGAEIQTQMEVCAVSLWNVAVAKKAIGFLSAKHNAILRHISCTLVFLCHPPEAVDEDTCNKQLMMAFKTIQAWLDCDNPSMAGSPISQATACLEKVKASLHIGSTAESITSSQQQKKQTFHLNEFKLSTYQAQIAHSQGEAEKVKACIKHAESILASLPEERYYLAKLCYNFGLDCFQKKKISDSIDYLRESYELSNGESEIDPTTQARTLRLLATAYLESDDADRYVNAMKAVDLANHAHSHVAGSYLKLRILLQTKPETDFIKPGLNDVLAHPDLTIDVALSAIELVFKSKCTSPALESIMLLTERYSSSPDVGRLWATHVEMLLSANKQLEARALVQSYAQKVKNGQQICDTIKQRLHYHMWERAAPAYEANNFAEALAWYNISLELFGGQVQQARNTDLAKLYRNLASCHLALKHYEEASVSADKAEELDPDSVHTQYVVFKVALMNQEEGKAQRALVKMAEVCAASPGGGDTMGAGSSGSGPAEGFICLAAQMAFDKNHRSLAIHALEQLIEHTLHDEQALTALRCITRLQLTFMEEANSTGDHLKTILKYIEIAQSKLLRMEEQKCAPPKIQQEASWFMKIAWNMGLQCENAHEMMYKMFVQCYKLCALCLSDMACWVRQRTCLLMAVAASLEVSRTSEGVVKLQALQDSLQCITECSNILKHIEQERRSEQGTMACGKDGTSHILLTLYEFEVRAQLADGQMETVLEKAISIPHAEPKTFETMAALAMECKMPNQSVAIRALKIAVKKHLQQSTVNFEKCSKAFHSLIELAFQGGSTGDDTSKEEVWGYYMDVISVIENNSQGQYPEMEILWLMTKAWNCGIHFYSCHKHAEATNWCDLAMKFLKYLTSFRENYESRMTHIYSEVRSKMRPGSSSQLTTGQHNHWVTV